MPSLIKVLKSEIPKLQMAKVTVLLCTPDQLYTGTSLYFYVPTFSLARQPVIKCALKSTQLNKTCNLLAIIDPASSHESVPLPHDSPGLFEHIGLCSRKQ